VRAPAVPELATTSRGNDPYVLASLLVALAGLAGGLAIVRAVM